MTRPRSIIERCQLLAGMSENAGSDYADVPLPAHARCPRTRRHWMEEAGMDVRVDAAGNLRGVYRPQAPAPAAATSVRTGYRARRRRLRWRAGRRARHRVGARAWRPPAAFRIEVVGVLGRGGRAFRHAVHRQPRRWRHARWRICSASDDGRRVTVREAIRDSAWIPHSSPRPVASRVPLGLSRVPHRAGAGARTLGLPLGVVMRSSARPPVRDLRGRRTTPAPRRWTCAATRWPARRGGSLSSNGSRRATAGMRRHRRARWRSTPGAVNVVPGEVRVSLDVRHADDSVAHASAAALLCAAREDRRAPRRCRRHGDSTLDQPAVAWIAALTDRWRGP